MNEYFERRKICKHDKGLTYGHCETFGGTTYFDIVCDYCLAPLYRTGGIDPLPVDKDPRLKRFASVPNDEHRYAALAELHFKIKKELEGRGNKKDDN